MQLPLNSERLTKMSSGTTCLVPLLSTLAPPTLFSAGSRKGLFDIAGKGKSGWLAGAPPGDGDAVLRRLRKGLLEDRLRLPGEGARISAEREYMG